MKWTNHYEKILSAAGSRRGKLRSSFLFFRLVENVMRNYENERRSNHCDKFRRSQSWQWALWVTWSSLRADKFPMVWMFCARTKWPIPRDQDIAKILGRIWSTGTLQDTNSGNTHSSDWQEDWSLIPGNGRRWKKSMSHKYCVHILKRKEPKLSGT